MVAIEEKIVEVTGLPTIGKHYPNMHDARLARAQFVIATNPWLDITKQGCKRASLLLSYNELAMHIIRYLKCEGVFLYLHAHHFKLLSCIRHNHLVNVLNFLYNMLCVSAEETQKGKDNFVTHHALIKLLIEISLRDVSLMSWA